MPTVTLPITFATVVLLAGCGTSDQTTHFDMTSGKRGAGEGPSTFAAAAPSPSSTGRGTEDSAQNNTGANAGGPH